MCENNSWQAPLWLTNAYLEKVLKKYLKDETVQIDNFIIKPATANGENYASVMSRIKISFKTSKEQQLQELSFIMKYSYESDPFVANIMTAYDVYNTEMKMYEQILPQLADILQECGETEQLFANTLKVDYDKSAIIFEDLTIRKYVVADRRKGLNETHARMVMKKLAKFHAAAAVLNERQNGALEKFDHGILNRHTRGFGCIFEYLAEEAATFAKSCPELGDYYCNKLTKLVPHLLDYGTRAYSCNPKHFYTLSHGDLWTTNMMMFYDAMESNEKALQDLMFIDFQLCNWSSAAVDLHYFFSTSLEAKLLLDINAQEELVQYYHSVLSQMLKKLNYGGLIPTLHDLCIQVEESKILALIATLCNRAIMMTDQSEDADIHSLLDDDERARKFRRNCFKNEDLQTVLKIVLPSFDRRGLLDLQK